MTLMDGWMDGQGVALQLLWTESSLVPSTCWQEFKAEGYFCPQCRTKVCDLPTTCPVCGLSMASAALWVPVRRGGRRTAENNWVV